MAQDHLFALPPGYELSGYRFGEVLGSGGYGITYKGEEITLGRPVAIKEYLPNTFARRGSDGVTVKPRDTKQNELFAWGIERFRQEAETLVQLQHPNIVRVLRYFAANGSAYIVMAYEKGTSLGERLADGATLSQPELGALVEPLLSGLETVHKARFLHRDIKPDNIYLRGDGSPVLLDFGSARQAIGARTQAITSIVSPGYSPFEQYGKAVGEQGPWTDIYALGATLYRCVTGDRPPEATRRVEARMKSKPDPLVPATRSAAGRYPPALLTAIDGALGVMESERPQSITAFRALIDTSPTRAGETLLAGHAATPVARTEAATMMAGAPSAPGRSGRRRRWPLAVATSAALLVAGGAVASYVIIDERRAEERRLAEDEARRKADEERRRAAAEEERRRIAAEAERKRRAEAEEAERKRKDEEARRRQDPEQIIEQARRDYRAAERAVVGKNYDAAIDFATRAINAGKLPKPEQAEAYLLRGNAWRTKGDTTRALLDYSAAVNEDPKLAIAWANRARIYASRGDADRAIADLDEAIRLRKDMWQFFSERGISHYKKRNYARAIEDYTDAIRIGPHSGDLYFNRGLAYEQHGPAYKAIDDFRTALRIDPNMQSARDGLRRLNASP